MNSIRLYLLGFISLFLVGCATMGDLRPESGFTFEVRHKSYNEVWSAAVKVATQHLTVVESDKAGGVLKEKGGIGWTTWGEVVSIFITPAEKESDRYTVEVVSKKRSKLQITGKNWESTIISGIKAELGM